MYKSKNMLLITLSRLASAARPVLRPTPQADSSSTSRCVISTIAAFETMPNEHANTRIRTFRLVALLVTSRDHVARSTAAEARAAEASGRFALASVTISAVKPCSTVQRTYVFAAQGLAQVSPHFQLLRGVCAHRMWPSWEEEACQKDSTRGKPLQPG